MANSYKDIIITPNRGSTTADPKIEFRGANSTVDTAITVQAYPTSNGTLSFEGSAGQLLSITNDFTGSIFSVNDVSGIPSIEVYANGQISLAPFGGNIAIGNNVIMANPILSAYKENVIAYTISSGTQTIDLTLANIFNLTLNSSVTLTFSNPPTSGTAYSLTLYCKQDGTGSRVITWPASVKWPNSSPPTMSTGANKIDIFSFFTLDGGTTYVGALALANTG
jgi:hypothetical protein